MPVMNGVVRCALLLLTCGLTVLPPGWCCAAARAVVSMAAPEKEQAPCCRCCCTQEAPANDETPTPPAERSWCCQRDPAVAVKSAQLDAADALVGIVSPLPAAVALPAWPESLRADILPPLPRLNVLHCTWLC